MARYAIVRNNVTPKLVENVIEWDGVRPWSPPPNHIAVQSDTAGLGWTYDGTTFTPPPAPPAPPQFFTPEELEAAADAVSSLADAKQLLRRFARGLGRIPKP